MEILIGEGQMNRTKWREHYLQALLRNGVPKTEARKSLQVGIPTFNYADSPELVALADMGK